MLTLIRKDILLHKTAFYGYLPVVVLYLAYLATQVESRNVFLTFSCIMGAILPMILIAREDKFGAESFICSLPVTRRLVVRAKYGMCWLTALAFVGMGVILYGILAPEQQPATFSCSTAGRVLLLLAVGLGVMLPFTLRFGRAGIMIALVGMQVLGILGLLVAQMFTSRVRLSAVFSTVSEWIESVCTDLGGPLFLATILVFAGISSMASCKVAEALFEGRDL
jgi:hypothetical protein